MTCSAFKKEMDARATGTTVFGLRQPELLACKICLPPLSTQRKIAAVLGALDDKIENNRKICVNLEAQAQAIFKSWFVDEYSQEIPLARVCTKISDGVHNTVSDEPGSRFMLLSCKNIINGVVDFSQGYRTIHQNTFQELRSRTQLEYGDVLVGSVGTIGEIALVNDNAEDYEFQRSVAILKPNKELISSAYLYYALNAYKKKLINVAHGAVQQCIFLGDFREFAIPFGSRRRIIQFDKVVMPLMREKYSLVKQTDSLAALRDALLPKLMSGEIDVEKVAV
jgi:type I restriction enzyme S subunit